jgi:hypothetical protein
MNTFGRALYLLAVEVVLLPFQLLALVALYIYMIVKGMKDYELALGEAVKITTMSMGVGAVNGGKIVMNYVKTGEVSEVGGHL